MIRIKTLLMIFTSASISLTPTSAGAQAPAPTHETTVTGCVAAAQRDGSLAAKGTGTAATPETAASEANNPDPTGKFILLDAAPISGKSLASSEADSAKPAQGKRTSYALRGHEQEMARHVGHRVQVTGTLMPPLAARLPEQTAATAEGVRALQVTSVKMLGTDCSARPAK
jgi:hypothetical protein